MNPLSLLLSFPSTHLLVLLLSRLLSPSSLLPSSLTSLIVISSSLSLVVREKKKRRSCVFVLVLTGLIFSPSNQSPCSFLMTAFQLDVFPLLALTVFSRKNLLLFSIPLLLFSHRLESPLCDLAARKWSDDRGLGFGKRSIRLSVRERSEQKKRRTEQQAERE